MRWGWVVPKYLSHLVGEKRGGGDGLHICALGRYIPVVKYPIGA
jgi:hypothetical protein